VLVVSWVSCGLEKFDGWFILVGLGIEVEVFDVLVEGFVEVEDMCSD